MADYLRTPADELTHAAGPEGHFNASVYTNAFDHERRYGGWIRLRVGNLKAIVRGRKGKRGVRTGLSGEQYRHHQSNHMQRQENLLHGGQSTTD